MLFSIYIAYEYFAVPIAEVAAFAHTLLRVVPVIGNIVTENSLSNFLPNYEQVNYMNNLAKQQVQKTERYLLDTLKKILK